MLVCEEIDEGKSIVVLVQTSNGPWNDDDDGDNDNARPLKRIKDVDEIWGFSHDMIDHNPASVSLQLLSRKDHAHLRIQKTRRVMWVFLSTGPLCKRKEKIKMFSNKKQRRLIIITSYYIKIWRNFRIPLRCYINHIRSKWYSNMYAFILKSQHAIGSLKIKCTCRTYISWLY